MPRMARIHYRQAVYHVMHQGNYKQNIFKDDKDYLFAYNQLEEIVAKYNCKIHFFCFMRNHMHLVIQVDLIPLADIMRGFSTKYSNYFNERLNRKGHLFRGRYIAKLIQSERYFLKVFHYIHSNPIEAGIAENHDSYIWTSHHAYKGAEELPWLTKDTTSTLIEKVMGKNESYLDFINHYSSDDIERLLSEGRDDFAMDDIIHSDISAKIELNLQYIELKEIIKHVSTHLDISYEDIISGSIEERVALGRALIAFYAHYCAGYTYIEISSMLNCRADSLGKCLRKHLSKEKKIPIFRNNLQALDRVFQGVCIKRNRENKKLNS
jgi:putative transposase